MGVPLALWSVDAVGAWLTGPLTAGLGGREQAALYAASLKAAEVDGELLSHLTDTDLELDLGIATPLHRRTILVEVARMLAGAQEPDYRGQGGVRSPPSVRERPQVKPRVVSSVDGKTPSCKADRALSSLDPHAWLCCETDAGQLYFHNTAANFSTYSPAQVPPEVLPPELRPADHAAPQREELILVSNRRFGRLSERMAASRRPTPASELPAAPGQLRDGALPAWALAATAPDRPKLSDGVATPIPTVQPPFEPLTLRADPKFSLSPRPPFVPRDKVDLSRHTIPVVASERTSISAVPALVEERYLHALKPALMTHLAAIAGPCPMSGPPEAMLRWCEGKDQVAAASVSSQEHGQESEENRVDLLAELYDTLGPALRDAPWIGAVVTGPGGLRPDEEGVAGLPAPLRQALQSALERNPAIGSGKLKRTQADSATRARPQEVARAFIEAFENTASTLLSGAEKARLAKVRRARHAAALEIQRSCRGWVARRPHQPWADEYRTRTAATIRVQSVWRGWAYRNLVWGAGKQGGSYERGERRDRVEAKEQRENAHLQLRAERYNQGWEQHFNKVCAQFGDANKYKKYILKSECQKRGLDDDGDTHALVERLAEYEADEAMAKESAVWDHEAAVEQTKKHAYENASVKLKLKRVADESARAAAKAEEESRAEAELFQTEMTRVNKLIKSAARSKIKPTTRQQQQTGQPGQQQDQVQRVTLEDVQCFKRTFDLFKMLRLPHEHEQQHSKSSITISGYRAGTAMRYLGCNPTEAELQELLREVALPEPEAGACAAAPPTIASGAGASDVHLADAGVGVMRVDFSGFVTMMARNMNSARKSEAELLAAFALFAAQQTAASESGAEGGTDVSKTAGATDADQESVASRTLIPSAELRHILQNTGERMTPEEIDLVLSGSATSVDSPEVDYVLLARKLLT